VPQKRRPGSRKRSQRPTAPKTTTRSKKKKGSVNNGGSRKRPAQVARVPTRRATNKVPLRHQGNQPARERQEAETLIPGAAGDDLAEELGEESIEAATSGQQAAEENLNAEVPEETGGPFVETSAATEFAYGPDASNPVDAEPAASPTTRRQK
jgi:hypothetical protein